MGRPPPPTPPPSPREVAALVRRALAEDRAGRDVTSRALVRGDRRAEGILESQARGVFSGAAVVRAVAHAAGLAVRDLAPDGARVAPGSEVARLEGNARRLLSVERTLLNFVMHLSGVASATARAVAAAGPSLRVYATRKTLPGLRDLEKSAVLHGGGWPHRRDLSSALLVKGNHLALVPNAEALPRARRAARRGHRRLEVEVGSVAEALAAARAGADALLLDNVGPRRARAIVVALAAAGLRRRVWVEVSGGITPRSVARYRACGADAASLGALTHSAPALAFHLVVRPAPAGGRRRTA